MLPIGAMITVGADDPPDRAVVGLPVSVEIFGKNLCKGGIFGSLFRSARLIGCSRGRRLGGENTQPLVEELAAKQSGRLRQFLRSRVRNAADIPDIIQEVFLRLLRVPSRETIRSPEAYIFTIARHAAQQHRLRSASADCLVELDETLSDFLPGPEPDPVLQIRDRKSVV